MVNLFRKLFIKNYDNLEDSTIRQAHGKLASLVGVFSNLVLFVMKILIGFFAGSISIIGDSFNNLSDMGSSCITLLGFKIAAKPADEDHPYGHERFEYISSLVVSILIIVIGVTLLGESITKFYHNLTVYQANNYSIVTFIILGVSIVLKLWQGYFNRKMGKIINSISLEATAVDSINDVISTSAILVAAIISYIWPNIKLFGYFISIDALMGIAVSIFILIAGVKVIKETIDPLIGVGPESDFVKGIVKDILAYEGVLGVHDILCHMYGPTKCFMSLHVEVDYRSDMMECHDLIDNIEREIGLKHHVQLVIHMDPVDLFSEEIMKYREVISKAINDISPELSYHDFRIVEGNTHTNVIFDCVVPFGFKISNEEIRTQLQRTFDEWDKTIFLVINFDIEYSKIKE